MCIQNLKFVALPIPEIIGVLKKFGDPDKRPHGQKATDRRPQDKRPQDKRPHGQKATGQKATGQKATGQKATGQKATGQKATATHLRVYCPAQ